MLHEYAIEPQALAQWGPLWQALEQFGIPNGRVIAQFPKKWQAMVYSATQACAPVERKALETRLQSVVRKLVRSNRAYDPTAHWRDNAQRQQATVPFHAIIQSDNIAGHPDVLTPVDLHESEPRWRVETQRTIPRTPNDLAMCIAGLCSISRELLFVDPYLSAEKRYASVFAEFMKRAHEYGRTFQRIEIHTGDLNPRDVLELSATNWIASRVARGVRVDFYLWREKLGGERLHRRYFLAETGGVAFEGGLDAGAQGQTTDVVLLSAELHAKRWSDYQLETAAFELIDRFTIVGSQRSNRRNG